VRDKTKSHAERGLALVSVLWALSILSLIAASMLSSGTLSYRMERNALKRVQMENLTEAGITRAILGLIDPRIDRRWRIDGVTQEFLFQGAKIKVAIQDEYGLIDLNEADASLFKGLFQSAGLTSTEADIFAARIIDWRTSGDLHSLNGANKADYRAAGLPYEPRGGPFQSVEELRLLLGMTPQLFARIAPALTVYSHQPTIDARTAPKEALLALPGMDPQKVADIISTRFSSAGTMGAQGLTLGAGVIDPAISVAGRVFGIRAEVSNGGILFEKHAVVRLTGDAMQTYMMLAWE